MEIDKENFAKNQNKGLANMNIDTKEHNKNVKNLKIKSIKTYRQKSAFKGLSVPKMDIKRDLEIERMSETGKETNSVTNRKNKSQKTQPLVIRGKIINKTGKEVRKMAKKVKEVKKKQRKGKSLLTAFKINRMEKRLTLNLKRAEIKGKYC